MTVHLQLPDHSLACGAEHTPYHTQELRGSVIVMVTNELCCTRHPDRQIVTCPQCRNVQASGGTPIHDQLAAEFAVAAAEAVASVLPWPAWRNRRYVPLYGAVD